MVGRFRSPDWLNAQPTSAASLPARRHFVARFLRAAVLDSTGRGMSVPDGLNAVSGLTALTAKRRDGHVRYLDTPSRRWLVYERDTHRDVGARAPRCLIFETHGAFRRAWDYPDNWYELSDEQLRALGAIDR